MREPEMPREDPMRLVCPACEAVYETPEGAIPEDGRWVRCSACRAEWMARPGQAGAAAEAAPALAADRPAPALEGVAREPDAPAAHATAPATPASAAPADARMPAEPPRSEAALARTFEEAPQARSGGGAVMAFAALIGFVLLAAVLAYIRDDAIATAAPQLAEPLERYVAWVDRMRAAIAALLEGGSA
jgi:predicted Zn finger-like uncharacterized protein